MSKATKRKHVTREVLDDYVLPSDNQQIVKVVASKGNNLHEVETPGGIRYLASMPTKFRKNVWIKRGDFIIVDPIMEGDKVKGEIVHILYKDQIKYIKEEKLWPQEFDYGKKIDTNGAVPEDMLPPSDYSDSEAEDVDLVCNVNRVRIEYTDSEEDSSEDED